MEEAAQKEARRLAEEEELREHRRKLQFKVCMISTMHLLSGALQHQIHCPATLASLSQNQFLHGLCCIVIVPLFMVMAEGCDPAGCTLLSVCDVLQARPVPTYGAPFLPSLSGSKLTEAKSPAFCTRSRDR